MQHVKSSSNLDLGNQHWLITKAARDYYDVSIAALRAKMINDSHWEDSVQLQKVKTFRQRCTRLLDGVTTSSTRSISWWGRMPGCRRNTCNSSRAQIRNGRVRESFINNNRWSWRGWTWWHNRKILQLATYACRMTGRMIVDCLHQDDGDTAFNEVSELSTKELLTGIQDSKAQGHAEKRNWKSFNRRS